MDTSDRLRPARCRVGHMREDGRRLQPVIVVDLVIHPTRHIHLRAWQSASGAAARYSLCGLDGHRRHRLDRRRHCGLPRTGNLRPPLLDLGHA